MGNLEEVGRAEARHVALVVAAAGRLVGLRRRHLLLDELAHKRLLVRLTPAMAEIRRQRRDAEPSRLLQQQFADRERPRSPLPGLDRLGRRMVLRFAGDGVARMTTPLTLTVRGFWLIAGLIEQPVSRLAVAMVVTPPAGSAWSGRPKGRDAGACGPPGSPCGRGTRPGPTRHGRAARRGRSGRSSSRARDG